MKTINRLQHDKRRLLTEIGRNEGRTSTDRRAIKKAREEIKLIDLCIRYLETAPSSDFVADSLAMYKTQIKRKTDAYADWRPTPEVVAQIKKPSQRKTYYDKMMGLPKLRGYVKTLSYLIGEK